MVSEDMSANSSSSSCVTSGGHGEWGLDIDDALANSAGEINMRIHEDVDPEGEFKVLAPTVEAPALPPADPIVAPAVPADPSPLMTVQEASGSDIVLAQLYGAEAEDVEAEKVHEDVKDVKVGPEVLVMNRSLMSITPDQLAEASEEVHVTPDQVNILQQVSAPDMDTKYTATFSPLVVPPPPANTDTPPTAPIVIHIPERMVKPELEPIKPQTPAKVMEKDTEAVEVPVTLERASPAQKRQKRLAVEKEYPESLNQAGPSSSDKTL